VKSRVSLPTPVLWTFRQSPFAGKARAAFAEKGVTVELAEVHPTGVLSASST